MNVALLSALLVVIAVPTASAQTRTRLGSYRLASVYRLDLPAKTYMSVRPSTKHGLVWVAITDGLVEIDKVEQTVTQGAAEWQEGAEAVGFRPDGTKAATFVVVDLRELSTVPRGARVGSWYVVIDNNASPFGIGPPDPNDPTKARMHKDESLEPGQTIDQAHGFEDLWIAVAPLLLTVQRNLSDEGEPLRLANPTFMKMAGGDVRWMKEDTKFITNVGKTNARFVTVGWWWRPVLSK